MTEETHRESGTLACGCSYEAIEYGSVLKVQWSNNCGETTVGKCDNITVFGRRFLRHNTVKDED